MNHPDEAPKLSKLPFIAGDLLLIATAVGIGLLTPAPIGPISLLAIGLCVIVGSALLVIPFIADYARRQDALLTERQNQIAALARTTAESAEQIAIATAGLHSLAESSAQNLKSLEKLPLQLQERIDALAQQLTSAKAPASPAASPSPAVTKANKDELARLEAASEKIARTLAQLEASAQAKTDAAESTGKALADLLSHATSQVESLALAAATASVVAAESTAQLLSERAVAAASAATAASAIEALVARAETIQRQPAAATPAAPLITTAEEGLIGDNADGNDGVFTPPAAIELATEVNVETDLDDEPLTDDEAALDEAPAVIEETEIEGEETEEDLAEEKAALGSEVSAATQPAKIEKTSATTGAGISGKINESEESEEADAPDADEDDASETDETEDSATTDEEPGKTKDEAEETDSEDDESDSDDASEDEDSVEDDAAETDETEKPAESDEEESDKETEDSVDHETDTDSVTADSKEEEETNEAASTPADEKISASTAADSFEPSEPHADEVPVDEPVAPKPPRARKTKPVEDQGFDLGLIPDGQEAAETAVTSDGFTRLVATAYIGIGNKLFIRGQGPGLSWDKGVPLQFVSIGKWRWETPDATAPITAKLYKNDQIECTGLGTLTLKPGHQHDVNAGF